MAFQNEDEKGIALGDSFIDFTTRVDKIPFETVVAVATEQGCKQEFAGVIHLLASELNIEPKFVIDDLQKVMHPIRKDNFLVLYLMFFIPPFFITTYYNNASLKPHTNISNRISRNFIRI